MSEHWNTLLSFSTHDELFLNLINMRGAGSEEKSKRKSRENRTNNNQPEKTDGNVHKVQHQEKTDSTVY